MKATPTFVCRCDFIIGLGKPKLYTKLEVASFSHYIRDSNLWGDPVAQSYAHFFGCDFMKGLGKPQLHAKVEVASFIHCKNIKLEPQI